MRQACLVELLDGCLYGGKVLAATALVAEGPHEDAGMVAKPANLVLGALHHGRTEQHLRRELLVGVAFHVGLSKDIETIAVTEVVEDGVVGVVAGAHGVDVQALHRADVLFDFLRRDGTSVDGADVMTVHAMEHHAATVDEEGAVVADAHFAEADLAATDVNGLAIAVLDVEQPAV